MARVVLVRDRLGEEHREAVHHPAPPPGTAGSESTFDSFDGGIHTVRGDLAPQTTTSGGPTDGTLPPEAGRVSCIHFFHKKVKYIWRADLRQFTKLEGLEREKCGLLYSLGDGLTQQEATLKLDLYAANSIQIELKPIWRLAFEEVTTPFYVYQMFICTVWCAQFYFSFSICVLAMSVFSVSLHVYETRKQSRKLREKVHSESLVRIRRDGRITEVMSPQLVPGDVIHLDLRTPFTLECDAVLLAGSVTVDESMLTGECVPISKVHLDEQPATLYSIERHKRSTLFCGTTITHTTKLARAIVIRTGFNTAKGELVRSILFPKEVNVKIKRDLLKCMFFFMLLGVIPMTYNVLVWKSFNASTFYLFITTVDIATFLVPPLLPAVLTSLNAQAQKRLAAQGIFCLDPSYIAYSGGLDMVCFDKTGTLTEDTIKLAGAVTIEGAEVKQTVKELVTLPPSSVAKQIIGTCHSLTFIGDELDGDEFEREG